MAKDISKDIDKEVNEYKELITDLENEAKYLVFIYLLTKKPLKEFNSAFKELSKTYELKSDKKIKKGFKKIDKLIDENFKDYESILKGDLDVDALKEVRRKIDLSSIKKANMRQAKVVKNFYKSSLKTGEAEYVDWKKYLSKKVSQYDKVTKVVPYHDKNTGKVVSYHDIAGYNSMVYNSNLTNEALNKTLDYCVEYGQDLQYIEPHTFSCPLCQEWQGQIISVSGGTYGYKTLAQAISGGLFHCNCSHVLTDPDESQEIYSNGEGEYSSPKWEERYKAKQKKQALELKRRRLKKDKVIYEKLENKEEVDKINSKISKLNEQIKEQRKIGQIRYENEYLNY